MKIAPPKLFIVSFLELFLMGALSLIHFLYITQRLSITSLISFTLIVVFLGYLIYILTFGIKVSEEQLKSTKNRIFYTPTSFTIHSPSLARDEIVTWGSVEAIFLLNMPPLEGEYHNFEYYIILNRQPTIVKHSEHWYDQMPPKPKSSKYPMLKINDHRNINFDTFQGAIAKHLSDSKNLEYYLSLKFGNETKVVQKGDSITVQAEKPLRTSAFYKIFDRNHPLDDQNLIRFRSEAINN